MLYFIFYGTLVVHEKKAAVLTQLLALVCSYHVVLHTQLVEVFDEAGG